MNKKIKKQIITFLIGSMLFSGSLQREIVKATEVSFWESVATKAEIKPQADEIKSDSSLDEDREVRVIVELSKKSILEEAGARGVDYASLDEGLLSEKKQELSEDRAALIHRLDEAEIEADMSEVRNYDTILNGVALRVKERDLEKLEGITGVRNIYISEEFERPFLSSSSHITGSYEAFHTLGYKGENTVVAVVDTGIDYNHSAMQLGEDVNVRLGEDEISRLLHEKNLPGRYYTKKVPYGYNYYDFNDNLFDSYGSMHGMHVSGIVGANDEKNHILGVAPHAQILAMKVFSDDLQYPTTFTDIWLKAIDDAISLGADVINMSLGSAAGFSIEGRAYPENEMIEKAAKAGISVVVAAGNEGKITDGNTYGISALSENFDTALIANPALNEKTIAVASMENANRTSYSIKWQKTLPAPRGRKPITYEREEEIDLTLGENAVGDALKAEWKEVSEANIDSLLSGNGLQGKFAVVELFENEKKTEDFLKLLEKVTTEEPAAIILYNHAKKEPEKIGRPISLEGEAARFTVARIKRSTYMEMKQDSSASFTFMPSINLRPKSFINPNGGRMSTFSSWGPTPDLRIKPEVTAPGGHIYSTTEDNRFKNMSGTSMASPQVAGAGALLKERIVREGIESENPADFIKLLLMNTASPVINEEGNPYFVRQQGSGNMSITSALSTEVVVTAEGTNDELKDGKLELKELDEKRFRVKLHFKNFGEKIRRYRINEKAVAELIEDGRRTAKPVLVTTGNILGEREVTVPGGSELVHEFELDYTLTPEIERNHFLEGFIQLEELPLNPPYAQRRGEEAGIGGDLDENEETFYFNGTNLNLPFLGFYGDWEEAKAIDAFRVKEFGEEKRAVQFYVNKDENMTSSLFITSAKIPLPVINDKLYLSPLSQFHRDMAVRIAPLRNMESIEYSILSEEGERLRVLGKSLNVRKLSRLAVNNSFNIMPDSLWDGRLDGEFAEEGKTYLYQIKAILNTGETVEKKEQFYRYPVVFDGTAPEIIGEPAVSALPEKDRLKRIRLRVKDGGSGVEDIYINSLRFVKNKSEIIVPPSFDNSPPKSTKEKDISEIPGMPVNAENAEISPLKDSLKEKSQLLGVPKFGKYLRLTFVDEERKENLLLPKVENGRVEIPTNMVPTGDGQDAQIFINRNGHRNSEIEVSIPYLADTTHFYISVKDSLSNKRILVIESGESTSFNSINFISYRYIEQYKAALHVNDIPVNKYIHDISGQEALVKIKMPDDVAHINFVSVKQNSGTKTLFKDYRVLEEGKAAEFLYDENTRTLSFKVKNITSNIEIVSSFKEGAMPKFQASETFKMNLRKTVPENYRQIKVNNVEVTLSDEATLDIDTGLNFFAFLFRKDLKNADVRGVLIHRKDGKIEILERKGSHELWDNSRGSIGYSFSRNWAVNVKYDVKKGDEIEIVYAGSEAEKLLRPYGNDLMEGKDKRNKGSKAKYPVIFLQTPSLLSMIPNNKENTIRVEGFIGHVKEGDSVKRIDLTVVNHKGKTVGQTISLTGEQIVTAAKTFNYAAGKTYKGMGYLFSADLPITEYFANIRIEAETVKGERASIVRRTFYDLKDPTIQYEILDRELSSETATLRIKSTDDSLRLRLFEGDSLIEVADKISKTLSEGGVVIEKEITLPLKRGQNRLTLKAVDLTGYKTEIEIFIFRTKE